MRTSTVTTTKAERDAELEAQLDKFGPLSPEFEALIAASKVAHSLREDQLHTLPSLLIGRAAI